MEVKINKEIREYTESVYFGLSLRQFICSILACVIAVVIYFVFQPILNVEILSWLCMFCAFPFVVFGFVKYNGMKAEEFLLAYLRSEFLVSKELKFVPSNFYYELCKEELESDKKNDENNKESVSTR